MNLTPTQVEKTMLDPKAIILPFLVAVVACSQRGEVPNAAVESVVFADWSDVTPEEWHSLASRTLFFGHQSVGRELMDGVSAVLAKHPELGIRVKEFTTWDEQDGPGLYHKKVGRNLFPGEKAHAFVEISGAMDDPGSVAMLKFCYVDVQGEASPDSIFADYQRQVALLRQRSPELTVVHFTLPLHTSENLKGYVKNLLLRRDIQRTLNVSRNKYNSLLRDAYMGREPVFDIAAYESRRPDGSFSFFTVRGERMYDMVEEYTDDGGHLTDQAAYEIGEQLLIFLAKLPTPDQPAGLKLQP
jgi:hypothetical protein